MGSSLVPPASSAASYSPTGTPNLVDEFTSVNTPVPTSVTRVASVPASGLTVYSSVGGTFTFGNRAVTLTGPGSTRTDNPTSLSSYSVNLTNQMSGITWRTNPNFTSLSFTDSSTGGTWIDGANAQYGFSRIAFGNNVFVFFSDTTGNYYTSADGQTWTTRTSPASNYGRIAFSGAYFYLFITTTSGGTATVYTSPDGITWTGRTFSASRNWSTPARGSGTNYVSIGMADDFQSSSATGSSQLTNVSTDGLSFSAGGNLPSLAVWGTPAADTTGRVVVSAIYDGLGSAAATTTKAAYSTNNGASWTASTLPSANNWMGVLYFNNLFIAVQRTSSTYATSTDGITWTSRAIPGGTSLGSARGIWIGNNGSVPTLYRLASGSVTGIVYWSTDGINWNTPTGVANAVYSGTQQAPTTNTAHGGIAFGNNVHVGAPGASISAFTSPISTFTVASVGVYAGSSTTI